jgi:hypothetical protein
MSDAADALSPPALRRDRSPEARRAARARRAERDWRILALVGQGASVAEIADREGVTVNHMRNQVRAVLRRRLPPAPAEFVAMQVSRLNEAMNISFSAMYNSETGANFQAIDQVMRIARALDRYHGFAVPRQRRQRALRLAATPGRDEEAAPEGIENGAARD